jgi:hypothetical protein
MSAYSGKARAGALFVFLSGRTFKEGPTILASQADLIFTGNRADERFGFSFDGGINLDGQGEAFTVFEDDIVIGAPGNDSVFVFLGPSARYPQFPVQGDDADRILSGGLTDEDFGFSVTGMKDIDGDLLDDLAVSSTEGSKEKVYLFFGRQAEAPLNETSLIIKDEMSASGVFISSVTDQGRGALALGALSASDAGITNGAVFIFGPETLSLYPKYAESEISLFETGILLNNPVGLGGEDMFGAFIQSSFDANSDGKEDILVGAPGSDINGEDSGFAVLYF